MVKMLRDAHLKIQYGRILNSIVSPMMVKANEIKSEVDKTLKHYVVCEVNSVTCKTVYSPQMTTLP